MKNVLYFSLKRVTAIRKLQHYQKKPLLAWTNSRYKSKFHVHCLFWMILKLPFKATHFLWFMEKWRFLIDLVPWIQIQVVVYGYKVYWLKNWEVSSPMKSPGSSTLSRIQTFNFKTWKIQSAEKIPCRWWPHCWGLVLSSFKVRESLLKVYFLWNLLWKVLW